VVRFPDEFFTYPYGYNRLLMGRSFFEAFGEFDYILVYQLDCFVFRDELERWCEKGFDYIGAPWFDDYGSPGLSRWTVGNGGFSLRRVSGALKVLGTRVSRGSLYPIPMPGHPQPSGYAWLQTNVRRRLRQHLGVWTVDDELANCAANEDRFWSFVAPRLCPDFRLPEAEVALEFAFETHPRECLEKNRGCLPFGCHAWTKTERNFWEDIIRRDDSTHV
jgi:hypothetical protein